MIKYRIVKISNENWFATNQPYIFSIQKSTWFGWKQLDWQYSEEIAKQKLNCYLDLLKSNGKTVYEVKV